MRLLLAFLVTTAAFPEIRPLKLKAVLELAMAQNPDVAQARLEERIHEAGWYQFQPLWDRISREQPDLFN